MKLFIKNILFLKLLLIAILTFASCDSDEIYDFPGESGNKVYIKPHIKQYNLTHTIVGDMYFLDYDVVAYSTQKAKSSYQVGISLDAKLVDKYNKDNGTNFKKISSDLLDFSKKDLIIKKGLMVSDTLSIQFKIDADLSVLEDGEYLIPVKLSNLKGDDVNISTNFSTTYFKLNVVSDEDCINDNGTVNDIDAKLVDDRSAFSISAIGEISTLRGTPADAFDNKNYSTWSISSSKEISVMVDLGKEYSVWGINQNYYGYNSAAPLGTKIYYSSDSKEWNLLGAISKGNKDILFYGTFVMQYIKMVIPTVAQWNGEKASLNLSEFNVYVKK